MISRNAVSIVASVASVVILMTAAPRAVAGDATLTVGSVGVAPGATARVPLTLSTEDLVGAFDFAVDASGLLCAEVDYNGPLFSSGWNGWDTTPAIDAQVSAACIFPKDQVTGFDIPLLDVLIEVPPDATPSSVIAVTLAGVMVSDYSFVPYDVEIVPGSIVIVSGACDEDVDGDGSVSFGDLLAVLGAWGPCAAPCGADIDADGDVGLPDLLMVLASWGACG